jgi:hypothetical protein
MTPTRVDWRPIYTAHKWDWSKSVRNVYTTTGVTFVETPCLCCPVGREVTLREVSVESRPVYILVRNTECIPEAWGKRPAYKELSQAQTHAEHDMKIVKITIEEAV